MAQRAYVKLAHRSEPPNESRYVPLGRVPDLQDDPPAPESGAEIYVVDGELRKRHAGGDPEAIGGGSPAGDPGAIQVNVAGAFGAIPGLAWDADNTRITVPGGIAAKTAVQPPNVTAGGNPVFVPTAINQSGNLSDGTYRYKFTYVTPSGETLPSDPTPPVDVNDDVGHKIRLLWPSNFDIAYPTITRIYRTEANGSVYKFHSEHDPNDTPLPNPLTDNTADGDLGADAPTVNTAIEPGIELLGDAGIRGVYSPTYGADLINFVMTEANLANVNQLTMQPQTRQGIGTGFTLYGGGATHGIGGALQLHGGDANGRDVLGFGGVYGGDVYVAGGITGAYSGEAGFGGNIRIIPGSKSGTGGADGKTLIYNGQSAVMVQIDDTVTVNTSLTVTTRTGTPAKFACFDTNGKLCEGASV